MLLCHTLGIGGSERQLTETAKALDPERFEVHVGAFHAEGLRANDLRIAGLPVIELPVRSFGNATLLKGAAAIRRYVKQHGVRLLHGFDVPLNIFLAFSFPLRPRPVILTSQRGHRSLAPALHRNLVRVSDRFTDGIIVNCEFMKRHLIEDEHVTPALIDVCYNGIDTERFSPRNAEPADAPVIGAVCALRAEKDLPTLLRAFALVRAQRDQTRLLILGSGPEESKLKSIAAELHIEHTVQFEPAAPNVVPWLKQMSIFVLPSVSEALSNALIEAMSCGVCAVASKVGGNPELIGKDERGCLFPPEDADALARILLHLINDPAERHHKASVARFWVEQNLSISAAAQCMAAIYERHLTRAGVSS